MGEAPGGTPGPKRRGSAKQAVRVGGHQAGQPFDFRQRVGLRRKESLSEGELRVFLEWRVGREEARRLL